MTNVESLKRVSAWIVIGSLLFVAPALVLADRGGGDGDGDRGGRGRGGDGDRGSVSVSVSNSGPGSSNSGSGNSNSGPGSSNSGPGSASANQGPGNANPISNARDEDDDRGRRNANSGPGNSGSAIGQSISLNRGFDEARIRVRANGRVEIRGAMVTAVNTANTSLQISVSDMSFTVNAGGARLLDRDDNPIAFSAFAVGNEVRVKGMFSPPTSTSTINATSVVNRSIDEDECVDEDGIFDNDDDDCVVVTPPDATAPVLSAIAAAPGVTSASITWTTNEPATSQVFVSTSSPVDVNATTTLSVADAALVTSHSITIAGLTASTTYNYVVRSADAAGNATTSAQFSFTTQQVVADTTAPSISGLAAALLAPATANITWTTNEPATSKVFFGTTTPLDLLSSLTMSVASTILSTIHSIFISGLTASTTYNFVAQSDDAAGNTATSSAVSLLIP